MSRVGPEVNNLTRQWVCRAIKNMTSRLRRDAAIGAGVVGVGKNGGVSIQRAAKARAQLAERRTPRTGKRQLGFVNRRGSPIQDAVGIAVEFVDGDGD